MLGHHRSVRPFRLGTALRTRRAGLAVFTALALTGCAAFSPDGGMEAVNAAAAPALPHEAVKIDSEDAAAQAHGRVRRLLASPLSADTAVQIALLNNKGLQAAYNELGIAEAMMVAASLPPNPKFSLSRVWTPIELDIERRIVADILALATLPTRAEIAADRFRQAQLRAAEETLRVAAEARRAFYRTVAARQLAAALGEASSAADAGAKTAEELGRTGAMSTLDQAREQSFAAELVAQVAGARQRAGIERERLIRVLGLSDDEIGVKLPQTLPPLPRRPLAQPTVESEALHRRVDLQLARIEVEALAKSHGLTHATRFINLLEVSGVSKTQREADGAGGTGGGAEIEFQVPIFDLGEARERQSVETYMQAVNRLTEKAINVRSEAREAYQRYRSSWDIAAHYRDKLLPLRKQIADETMLRYGAMQIDVFGLLTEARQRLVANTAAIDAQRDFWLASTDLRAAVVGGGAPSGDTPGRTAAQQASDGD